MEYCEDQHGTIICIRAVQGHGHGVAMNPNLFSLKQTPSRWKEHITPHGQLFQLYINPGVFSVDRRIESEKHETRLFLLTSCPRESSSRH